MVQLQVQSPAGQAFSSLQMLILKIVHNVTVVKPYIHKSLRA
jgi:hypothetical protein